MPLPVFRLPEECPEGGHQFAPHAHLWDVAGRTCPGRFWCVRCRRWFDGVKCARRKARAA